jgi:serine/threonine protein kinase
MQPMTEGKMLKRNNELAAVKVVFLKEDEVKETLLEMEILQSCNHPNITQYYGCFLKGLDLWVYSHLYKICMEFCGAGSVDAIYRAFKKPLGEDVIGSLIYESLVVRKF